MEYLEYGGWTFVFDKKKTALHDRYGSVAGDCSCADCRNYRKT